MISEELTPTGQRKGQLMRLRAASEMLGMCDSTIRARMKAGDGPPGFKRPKSSYWLFWEGELLDYLESDRRKLVVVQAGPVDDARTARPVDATPAREPIAKPVNDAKATRRVDAMLAKVETRLVKAMVAEVQAKLAGERGRLVDEMLGSSKIPSSAA